MGSQRLKDYLVQGYSLNQQRLEAQQEKLAELRQAIALSARLIHNKSLSTVESQGILAILEKYSHALTVLDDYDHQRLRVTGTHAAIQPRITYAGMMQQIGLWRERERLGGLFGNEKVILETSVCRCSSLRHARYAGCSGRTDYSPGR